LGSADFLHSGTPPLAAAVLSRHVLDSARPIPAASRNDQSPKEVFGDVDVVHRSTAKIRRHLAVALRPPCRADNVGQTGRSCGRPARIAPRQPIKDTSQHYRRPHLSAALRALQLADSLNVTVVTCYPCLRCFQIRRSVGNWTTRGCRRQ